MNSLNMAIGCKPPREDSGSASESQKNPGQAAEDSRKTHGLFFHSVMNHSKSTETDTDGFHVTPQSPVVNCCNVPSSQTNYANRPSIGDQFIPNTNSGSVQEGSLCKYANDEKNLEEFQETVGSPLLGISSSLTENVSAEGAIVITHNKACTTFQPAIWGVSVYSANENKTFESNSSTSHSSVNIAPSNPGDQKSQLSISGITEKLNAFKKSCRSSRFASTLWRKHHHAVTTVDSPPYRYT